LRSDEHGYIVAEAWVNTRVNGASGFRRFSDSQRFSGIDLVPPVDSR
jgi:hypothetical protein